MKTHERPNERDDAATRLHRCLIALALMTPGSCSGADASDPPRANIHCAAGAGSLDWATQANRDCTLRSSGAVSSGEHRAGAEGQALAALWRGVSAAEVAAGAVTLPRGD